MRCLSLIIFAIAVSVINARPQGGFFFPDQDFNSQTPFSNGPTRPNRPNRPNRPTGISQPPQPTTTPASPASTVSQADQISTTTGAPTVSTTTTAYRDCLANCPTTSEYNPVCGNDNVNYNNRQRLECANYCGPRVMANWTPIVQLRIGTCAPL